MTTKGAKHLQSRLLSFSDLRDDLRGAFLTYSLRYLFLPIFFATLKNLGATYLIFKFPAFLNDEFKDDSPSPLSIIKECTKPKFPNTTHKFP